MNLTEDNKLKNFCHSCKNRSINKDGTLICGIKGYRPRIYRTCNEHTYDPSLEVVLKKHLLENRYKKAELINLFDFDYEESVKDLYSNSSTILKPGLISWYFNIGLYVILFVIVAWLMLNKKEVDVLLLVYGVIILTSILQLRKLVISGNKSVLVMDVDGIQFDEEQILWGLIAGLYLYRQYDYEGDINEECIILLHHSGQEYSLNVSNFEFSIRNLKRLVNSYRTYGLYKKKSVYCYKI
jgi:hypothetical protein